MTTENDCQQIVNRERKTWLGGLEGEQFTINSYFHSFIINGYLEPLCKTHLNTYPDLYIIQLMQFVHVEKEKKSSMDHLKCAPLTFKL